MSSFFLSDPLGTFLSGLVLGACAAGGAAAYYRSRLNETSCFLGALLARPDLYGQVRRGEWAKQRRAE